MKVIGYGRVSQDDQETSPENQRDTILNEFCTTTDTDELGQEEHELVGFYCDKHVSGLSELLDRPEFTDMLEDVKEDTSIEAIVVKNFSRLSRSRYIIERVQEDIKNVVGREVEIVTAVPWLFGLRRIPNLHPESYDDADDIMEEYFRKRMFEQRMDFYELESVIAKSRTKTGLEQQRERGGALGSNPRGLITPKMAYEGSDDTTTYVPTEEIEPSQQEQWEAENGAEWWDEHTEFSEVVEVLNLFAQSDTDPHENYIQPTAGGIADEYGWSGGSTAVKNVWDRRGLYRDVAERIDYIDESKLPENP